jgi:DNA-binding response OmpR family regulator
MKILVIDDNPQDQKIVKRYLDRFGYGDVIFANTGETGIAMVKSEKPDIVITDTNLPGMDGFEVCRQVKGIEGAGTSVIVVTGHIDAVDAGRARECGADDYCVKTADCSLLLEAIKNLIPRQQ